LSRVCQRQVGEMTEGAAMREVIVGVIGGKRRRLERERNCNQEQYRKRPYIEAMKLHTLLNYTVIHATRAEGIA